MPESPDPFADWNGATGVKTATGADWTGNLEANGVAGRRTPEGLVWDAGAETGIGERSLIDLRIVFTGPSSTDASGIRRVTIVPNAFGGMFGPGWVSDLARSDSGTAGYTVVDRTGTDGSINVVDPEGESFVYRHSSGT